MNIQHQSSIPPFRSILVQGYSNPPLPIEFFRNLHNTASQIYSLLSQVPSKFSFFEIISLLFILRFFFSLKIPSEKNYLTPYLSNNILSTSILLSVNIFLLLSNIFFISSSQRKTVLFRFMSSSKIKNIVTFKKIPFNQRFNRMVII